MVVGNCRKTKISILISLSPSTTTIMLNVTDLLDTLRVYANMSKPITFYIQIKIKLC